MGNARWRHVRSWGLGCLVFWVGCQVVPLVVVYAPSASLRKGWYLRDFRQRALAIGDYVVVGRPSALGSSLGGPGVPARLLKQVAAAPHDAVCWDDAAMTVTRAAGVVVYPYHPAAPAPRHPVGCQTVGVGELVLVGTHPRSYDSRYFGVVDGSLLQFRVRPVWTWEVV